MEYVSTNPSDQSTINGMFVAATVGNATIQNNVIGDLRGPNQNNSNPSNSLCGIVITSNNASNVRTIYHNTVYLNATSTGAVFSSAAIYTNVTSGSLTMRNNIFVNLSTPNGTGGYSSAFTANSGLVNYATASNNNLFYAGTPSATKLIYYGATAADIAQTLADFQAKLANARDAQSVSLNPTFLSTSAGYQFLRIDPTISSAINGGATTISGLTTDIDGDTRSGTPDIGADEFSPAGTSCTPPTAAISTSGSTTLCNCNSVTLTASGGTQYLWNTGETGVNITVYSAGTYTVTVTNASGCKATATQTVSMTAPTPVTTTATASSTYTWSSNGQTYTQTGRYINVISSCVTDVLQLTITPSNALPVNWLHVNGSYNSFGKTTINWRVSEQQVSNYAVEKSTDGRKFPAITLINSKGDGINQYSYTDEKALTGKGWYRIKQTDLDGKTSYSPVMVMNENQSLGISRIYPNPTNGSLSVSVHQNKIGREFSIVSASGLLMKKEKIKAESFTIDIGNFPPGMYYIRIADESPLLFSKLQN